MHRLWSLIALLLLSAPALAQGPAATTEPFIPASELCPGVASDDGSSLSNRNFPHFIGWMSNPLENIDPRALTQIQPIFGSAWMNPSRALPNSDMQLYGPAVSVALSDRLGVGINQGGYAVIHVDRNDPRPPLRNFLAATRGREFGGTREGFLNIGGFAQYTLIEDVPNQFLLTGGLRFIAPCGAYEVFQGHGPLQLVPYLTVGQEFGHFHLLGTLGYQFPVGGGGAGLNLFNCNVHLDRECFGWLYPLVEFNCIYHTESVGVDLPTRVGYFDFGNFASTGNIVTMAVGANAVLIRDRLEFGAVYMTKLASQRNFDLNGLLVKLTLRF